jgi:glycosyltransferase involved in cell wall biosynthesis
VRQLAQRISKICNDNGCSVVYFIDVTLYTGELLRQIAEISPHIKIILTVHDPIPHLESKTKLALFLEKKNNLKILNLTNRKSVFIHVHSKSLVQGSFLEGCQNLVEAPHPIPDRVYSDEFRIHPRLDYAMPQRKINIGFMGRIEEYKGLSLLYQSFYYLASKEPHLTNHLKITICGRGHIADEWTSLPYEITIINSGITDEIFHKNLLNLDLLVLPYLEATQSGVAVLANAYEIPMIATDVGIIKDTLVIDQHNGIIIKPNNVDMLTEKIREFVINQSLAVMLTQNARKPFD